MVCCSLPFLRPSILSLPLDVMLLYVLPTHFLYCFNTVDSRYLDFVYLELPLISK